MRKQKHLNIKWILLLFSTSFFYGNVFSQHKPAWGYTSSFYGKPIAPVNDILILYRREYYTKKSFELLKNGLEHSAIPHNVLFRFAVTGSAEADSLQKIASFICRINVTEVMQNYAYSLGKNPGEFRKSYVRGKGFRKFSIIGFLNNTEIPVWKCFCDIEVFTRKMPEERAAECLFSKLLSDGIIK